MNKLADFFGFGREGESISILLRFLRSPLRFLSDSRDEEKSLIAILVIIERIMLTGKLLDIFFFEKDLDSWEALFTVLFFIFAKQVAQFALWINGYLTNLLVRLFARKNDLMAAKRAYTFSSIIPNPILYAFTLGSVLRHVLNPVVSTFVIYGICWVAGTLLECIAITRQYRLSLTRSILIIIVPVVLTTLFIFQIPFYLSVRFSPPIVKQDVDLKLLELTKFEIDNTKDGSQFFKEPLLILSDKDSLEIATYYKEKKVPDRQLAAILEEHYTQLSPLLESTWFNKKKLDVNLPEFPIENSDSSAIALEYFIPILKYFKSLILLTRYLVETSQHTRAVEVFKETLELCRAVGKANLGLSPAILATVYPAHLAAILDSNLIKLDQKKVVSSYEEVMANSMVNPEWTINAIRQEYYQTDAVHLQTFTKVWEDHRRKQDSIGFYVPDYTFKKFFDLEDTRRIHAYIYARIIKDALNPSVNKDLEIHELKELSKGGKLKLLRFMIYKNTIGRVLLEVSVPLYSSYGHDAFDNKRYMEFVYILLLLKNYYLDNGIIPKSLDEVVPDTNSLEFYETFTLKQDSLVSMDKEKFKKVYKRKIY